MGWEIRRAILAVAGYICERCGQSTPISSDEIGQGVCAFQCHCGAWNAIPFQGKEGK